LLTKVRLNGTSGDFRDDRRLAVATSSLEANPAFEPEGSGAGSYFERWVGEGQVVGVQLRADGELPGGEEVEEGDPGEVHQGGPPEARDVVQRPPEPRKREEVELAPQLYHDARTGLSHLDAVQVSPSHRSVGSPDALPQYVGPHNLRCGYGIRDTSRKVSIRVPAHRVLLSYLVMGRRGEISISGPGIGNALP
jgi:hypothetical protein